MKTSLNYLTVGALAALICIGSSFAANGSRNVVASPRALEAFPELARTAVVAGSEATSATAYDAVAKNRALASSPRALELFPQLGRPVVALSKAPSPAVVAARNPAYAASPRTLELFPELSRTSAGPTFEIAPLIEKRNSK